MQSTCKLQHHYSSKNPVQSPRFFLRRYKLIYPYFNSKNATKTDILRRFCDGIGHRPENWHKSLLHNKIISIPLRYSLGKISSNSLSSISMQSPLFNSTPYLVSRSISSLNFSGIITLLSFSSIPEEHSPRYPDDNSELPNREFNYRNNIISDFNFTY